MWRLIAELYPDGYNSLAPKRTRRLNFLRHICPFWILAWQIIMLRNSSHRGSQKILMSHSTIDAEDRSAKTVLAAKLNELVNTRGLSQTVVADITCMTQPKVSQVRRYNLQNISLERLMQALVSLDQHVEIVVRPARRARSAGITVNLA
jgi:predicted XRE-type DNA-binding protein